MSNRSTVRPAREAVWGPLSTRIRSSRVRNPAILAYRVAARTVLVGRGPRIFANSIPKAGTHLLTQLLGGVDGLWFSGLHIIDKQFRGDAEQAGDGLGDFDVAAFQRRLATLRRGQFVTAHFASLPGVSSVLDELDFRRVLMIRDPRDIAVSLAFYFSRNARVRFHRRFAALPSDHARIMAAITGLPASSAGPEVPSIADRFDRYREWLTDDGTCVVRFEELVGPNGGGTETGQLDAVRRVLQHCARPADDATVHALASKAFAKHAATFRRGEIGDWTNHLDGDHQAAFASVAGGLLREFGYS